MEWLRVETRSEYLRVATDEIVYVQADGNYSEIVLTNGKSRIIPCQLHVVQGLFETLRSNPFVRLGRSLLVNKRYVFVINLTTQTLIFSGQQITGDIKNLIVSRDALKELTEKLQKE